MKKIFAVIALAIAMMCSVLTANAQSVDPKVAYDQCREFVVMGDASYDAGQFAKAQTYYEEAIKCNMNCPDRKYMSDRKINKKLNNCVYALNHNGKTIEQEHSEKSAEVAETIGAILAVGVIAGAVAGAVGHDGPHHPEPHHDFHHDYHHDYHFDHHDPHHHHHF